MLGSDGASALTAPIKSARLQWVSVLEDLIASLGLI